MLIGAINHMDAFSIQTSLTRRGGQRSFAILHRTKRLSSSLPYAMLSSDLQEPFIDDMGRIVWPKNNQQGSRLLEADQQKVADETRRREKAEEEEAAARKQAEELERARIQAAEALEKARIQAEELEKARIQAEELEKARIQAEELEKVRIQAEKEAAEIAARIQAEELEKTRIQAEKEAEATAERARRKLLEFRLQAEAKALTMTVSQDTQGSVEQNTEEEIFDKNLSFDPNMETMNIDNDGNTSPEWNDSVMDQSPEYAAEETKNEDMNEYLMAEIASVLESEAKWIDATTVKAAIDSELAGAKLDSLNFVEGINNNADDYWNDPSNLESSQESDDFENLLTTIEMKLREENHAVALQRTDNPPPAPPLPKVGNDPQTVKPPALKRSSWSRDKDDDDSDSSTPIVKEFKPIISPIVSSDEKSKSAAVFVRKKKDVSERNDSKSNFSGTKGISMTQKIVSILKAKKSKLISVVRTNPKLVLGAAIIVFLLPGLLAGFVRNSLR
jgi:hypothetical protein